MQSAQLISPSLAIWPSVTINAWIPTNLGKCTSWCRAQATEDKFQRHNPTTHLQTSFKQDNKSCALYVGPGNRRRELEDITIHSLQKSHSACFWPGLARPWSSPPLHVSMLLGVRCCSPPRSTDPSLKNVASPLVFWRAGGFSCLADFGLSRKWSAVKEMLLRRPLELQQQLNTSRPLCSLSEKCL